MARADGEGGNRGDGGTVTLELFWKFGQGVTVGERDSVEKSGAFGFSVGEEGENCGRSGHFRAGLGREVL